jgi:hypothetical protein
MKKNRTRLQLTKTTVRVLRDADLTVVHGGGGVIAAVGGGRTSTIDPTACVVGGSYGCDGEKL